MNGRTKLQGNKHFYAGHNSYGVNISYSSMGWSAYAFDTKAERDEWVNDNSYFGFGRRVAEPIDSKTAYKIAGVRNAMELYQNESCNSELCAEW